MIRKDSSFCDQNLQFVAVLYKKFKILTFIFFNFNFSFLFFLVFFQNIFYCNISFGRGLPTILNLLFSKYWKSYNGPKN